MTARPKQILLWAATGLIWLGAFVGGPALVTIPLLIPALVGAWPLPSSIQLAILLAFALLWLAALVWVGLRHHGKARWTHFVIAGVITGGMFLPGLVAPPLDHTPQVYRVL